MIEIAHEEQPESETLALAEETAVELAQRLKLLRAAWGVEAEELDLLQLQAFGEALSSNRRLRLDLEGLDAEAVFPPAAAKVVLNLLLLAAESLPAGGVVALAGSPGNTVLVTIAGPRAAWPAGFVSHLTDDSAAWAAVTASPRHLQGPLTALLARAHGCRLSILMPAGAGGEGDMLPPLLLSFGP